MPQRARFHERKGAAGARTSGWRGGQGLRRLPRLVVDVVDVVDSTEVIDESPRKMPNFGNRKRSMPHAPGERSRQGSDKRQLIVDAAIKVFAEKGYPGSRIADIAREAEIAYGLVYHYFKNKEDILDAIFFERWEGFIEAVEAIANDRHRKLEPRLLSIAELILSSYREGSEWVKVLVFEIQRSQRFSDPARIKVVGQLFTVIAEMLREAQGGGELRSELDPDLASYVFIGGLDIVVTSRVLDLIAVEGDEEAYYGQIARTVVDLFLNGMREPQRAGEAARGADPANRK